MMTQDVALVLVYASIIVGLFVAFAYKKDRK